MGDILEVVGSGPAVTGVSTDFIAVFDVSAYSSFILSLNGTFSLTLQAQFVNDLAQPFVATNALNPGTTGISTSLAAVGQYIFPKSGRFLRIRCSAFTSNTSLVGILECYTTAIPFINMQISQVGGTSFNAATIPYPTTATPTTSSSGNQANAAATATLTGAAGVFTYLTGFEVTGTGATGVLIVLVTVTGLAGGTATYIYTFVAGVTTQNQSLIVAFNPPLKSSAVATNIVVSCPASGAGGTNNAVVAHGYTL
jgi:hypothetical protein